MPRRLRIERQGFTLIEILAVIIIMSIIAGLLVAAAIGARRKADRDAAQAGVAYIVAQIEAYMNKRGQLPPNRNPGEDDFTTEAEIYTTLNEWNYPVPPARQADPWGNPYIIVLARDYGVVFPLDTGGECYSTPPFDRMNGMYSQLPWPAWQTCCKEIRIADPADDPPDDPENYAAFNDQPNGFQVISAGPDGLVSRVNYHEVNADNFVNW